MKFRGSAVFGPQKSAGWPPAGSSALFTVGSSIHYTFSGLLLFTLLLLFLLVSDSQVSELSVLAGRSHSLSLQ